MSVPTFDPHALSDDELARKQADLQARIAFASNVGSGGAVAGLQHLLVRIEDEMEARFQKMLWAETSKIAMRPIETDPAMAAAPQADEDERPRPREPRARIVVRRTRAPASLEETTDPAPNADVNSQTTSVDQDPDTRRTS